MEQAMSGHLTVGGDKYDLLPKNRGGMKSVIFTLPVIPDNEPKRSNSVHTTHVSEPSMPQDRRLRQPSQDQ